MTAAAMFLLFALGAIWHVDSETTRELNEFAAARSHRRWLLRLQTVYVTRAARFEMLRRPPRTSLYPEEEIRIRLALLSTVESIRAMVETTAKANESARKLADTLHKVEK